MQQPSYAAAAAAGAAQAGELGAARPPSIETAISASSSGSPMAGKSPLGPGSRTVSGAPAPGAGGTPNKSRQGSGLAGGGGSKPLAKEQGRFRVYEGDEPPPFRCVWARGRLGAESAS
jgi:hypothetical protein